MGAHRPADSRSRDEAGADRRRHYSAFYGLEPLPSGPPLAMVHGNCQAESLRLTLAGPDLVTVRVPPVHELTSGDLPHLARLLPRVSVLISQPIHDGYRDLPLGSRQLAAQLAPGARLIRVPVIRFAGLYPAHAIIRPPSDRSAAPPLVPYHDLRTLSRAAGLGSSPTLNPDKVQRLAAASSAELRRRERTEDTVGVSDLFDTPGFDQMRTLNHPGNVVWASVARRVRDRLGLGEAPALTRPLLNGLHAPREPEVIEAFALDAAPEASWFVEGVAVDPADVRAAHLAWYRQHPDAVEAGLRRHAPALKILLSR